MLKKDPNYKPKPRPRIEDYEPTEKWDDPEPIVEEPKPRKSYEQTRKRPKVTEESIKAEWEAMKAPKGYKFPPEKSSPEKV